MPKQSHRWTAFGEVAVQGRPARPAALAAGGAAPRAGRNPLEGCGLELGDQVFWKYADADVPPNACGRVLHFDYERVCVAFGVAAYMIKPHELLVHRKAAAPDARGAEEDDEAWRALIQSADKDAPAPPAGGTTLGKGIYIPELSAIARTVAGKRWGDIPVDDDDFSALPQTPLAGTAPGLRAAAPPDQSSSLASGDRGGDADTAPPKTLPLSCTRNWPNTGRGS